MKYTRYLIRTLALVLAGLLPLGASHAHHVEDRCKRSDNKPLGLEIDIPITANIGRDVAEGEAYGPWFSSSITWICTRTAVPAPPDKHAFQPPNDKFQARTDVYAHYTEDKGIFPADPSFRVYRYPGTNIGFIARVRQGMEGDPMDPQPLNGTLGAFMTTTFEDSFARQHGSVSKFHLTLEVRLVKLQGVWIQHARFTPFVVNFWSTDWHPGGPPYWIHRSHIYHYLKTTISNIAAACKTPAQTVDLGTTYTASLQGPHGAGPATDFSLPFENCPLYMASVAYKFHPVPKQTIIDGILPLVERPDSATGVGVQVLQPDGTPLAFDTSLPLTDYDPNTPVPLYTAPLKARIVRTHNSLSSGSVQALMEMEVTYK